jgi:hypothetical protein
MIVKIPTPAVAALFVLSGPMIDNETDVRKIDIPATFLPASIRSQKSTGLRQTPCLNHCGI